MRMTAWLVAMLMWGAGAAQDVPFQLGLAEIDITPPAGYRMDGYFYERLNTGQRDALKAKAVVFRQGETRGALVVCDLIGVPQTLTNEVRALASARTGIPAANIAVTATHSHTGPLFAGERSRLFSERAAEKSGKDPLAAVKYPEMLRDRLVEAIVAANGRVSPAGMELARTEEDRVSFNRRFHMKDGTVRFNPGINNPDIVRPAGPIDPDLPFLLFTKDKKPAGSLTAFALHADTVGGTEYSADYSGQLAAELRREFGDGFTSIFGLGTCGDINHIDVSGARRYDARLIGQQLAVRILSTRSRVALDQPALAVVSTRLSLPLREVSEDEARLALARRDQVGGKELPFLEQVGIVTTLDLLQRGPALDAEIQVFRLNRDVAIVLLPGEVFVELGLSIKKSSPFRHTFVIELANDNPAYIPTEKAFKEGSYETVNSRIVPGGGERLASAAIELLKQAAAR